MCEELATSVEHVPPKCLFPEKKDLREGMDLRKHLLKVPACDAHNSKKSHNDEYFLYVLTGMFQINKVGRNQYNSKIRRAIKRNPSLLKKLATTAMPVKVTDPLSGSMVDSVALKFDEDRVNIIFDRLSRAIYYHHYKEKWLGRVKYQAEFLFATVDPSDELNLRIKAISKAADGWFSRAIYYGENPEVFKYQAVEAKDSRKMRLHFYEGCKLLLIFDSQLKSVNPTRNKSG
jgi:hypothetical protein